MRFFKKTIKDVPISGKTVLLRADYNVPLTPEGEIHDDYRIRQSIQTLRYLLEQNCTLVLCSHLGRPEGKVNPKFSLAPVATRLSELLGQEVTFISDCVGDIVAQTVKNSPPRSVFLLENLRFHPEEEANDAHFACRMAKDSTAQYFVQDGFGVVHRAHASTDAITQCIPSVAGFLVEKEFTAITAAIQEPRRPLVVVLGGAKVADKIPVIERFIEMADTVVVGGAIANTFLKFYGGYNVGKSIYDEDATDVVASLMSKVTRKWCSTANVAHGSECQESHEHFILPVDVAVSKAIDATQSRQEIPLDKVGNDDYILDVGKETIGQIIHKLQEAKTVIWNGPLGYAEIEQFAYGSNFVAGVLASYRDNLQSVVGGGDTADFVIKWAQRQNTDVQQCFGHISTGGGAGLELMAGEKLPGVEALMDA